METTCLNNPLGEYQDEPPAPGTTEKPHDLKPTSKGVENAKKRLRAFSIQKKSSLSPVTLAKTSTTVGSVGTVFIGKLASSKPALKPGDIEEVLDPKKPPKPPKPGTSKLQNVSSPLADYLNIQKKTLSEIEAMKRKMELVDLGIPLGLICPAPNSDKAMPTKAMPPIKSMLLDPAKVDEIIREAKKAKAEGKPFKFSYEKLLPSYQNPFQKNKDKDRDKEAPPLPTEDPRVSRDRRKYSDNFRRYSGHKDDKRGRDWRDDHRDGKERMRASIIREREARELNIKRSKEKYKRDAKPRDVKERAKSKEKDVKSKETDVKSKDSKSKEKIDTINLLDEDDEDVQEVIEEVPAKDAKETDVNLKDFVVCDSWSENEDKKDPTPNTDKKDSKTTPLVKFIDPMEQLKQSLIKEVIEPPAEVKVEKLQPVTDSFKFEIEEENDDEEILDMFADSNTSVKRVTKKIPIPVAKKDLYDSPVAMRFDFDASTDGMDDSFLESVIAEIKHEDIIDDDVIQDKGLVEYDVSPKEERESVTPELDDRIREMYSNRSDCSDGFKSVESVKSIESGFKSIESGYKSTESGFKSTDSRGKLIESLTPVDHKDSSNMSPEIGFKSTDSDQKLTKGGSTLKPIEDGNMPKSTVDSLETWSFVLKICQPLLFRHDKNKCYKETRGNPKVWFAENPKLCDCVKDRSVVYEELEMCKMELVNTVYGKEQVQEAIYPEARGWYPAASLCESGAVALSSEWEAEDSQERPTPPPHSREHLVLDREYQKFMEAVWPDVEGATKSETPRSTPVRETKKRMGEEAEVGKKKKAKLAEGKMSSEGWSQESEVEEDVAKKKRNANEKKRKRKHSTSISDSEDESPSKKKKKASKKEKKEKTKIKVTKRRLSKKYLKKLKEKQEKQLKKKKKLAKFDEESDVEDQEKLKKKKEKKLKKKKLLKQKKKISKKKSRSKSSSSSSTSSDSERKSKKKNKKKKHKKQNQSSSDQSEELFDANILKNIKTERLTDDEKAKNFTSKKHREIINVKQLQNDFVSIQIKKEIEDVNSPDEFKEKENKELEKVETEMELIESKVEEIVEVKVIEAVVPVFEEKNEHEFKEPEYTRPITPQLKPILEENNSQCSSQESIISLKQYEKDDSHLRPSSQNSNYNFHDVMQNEGHRDELYQKEMEIEMDGEYEQGNYEMYEQMAMEYQCDVASQRVPPPDEQTSGRIETVVHARSCGEIKCDWRAGDPTAADPTTPTQRPSRWGAPSGVPEATPANTTPTRPSRWGLKPSEVNIVLTGGEGEQSETFQIQSVVAPTVYKIQSIANRSENSNIDYDQAYMDMYGASDRLQYGDCFSREATAKEMEKKLVSHHTSLDERINQALRTTVLGEVAKNEAQEDEGPERGILVTKSLAEIRNVKRVSFADGYKPGQDSDTEEPPVVKRKKGRRTGCPWPCPASHRDHVSLWDALPPPPPPPGSPPPPAAPHPPPTHLLRSLRNPSMMQPGMLPQAPHPMAKFDPNSLAAFMPPEPPPGLISF